MMRKPFNEPSVGERPTNKTTAKSIEAPLALAGCQQIDIA